MLLWVFAGRNVTAGSHAAISAAFAQVAWAVFSPGALSRQACVLLSADSLSRCKQFPELCPWHCEWRLAVCLLAASPEVRSALPLLFSSQLQFADPLAPHKLLMSQWSRQVLLRGMF